MPALRIILIANILSVAVLKITIIILSWIIDCDRRLFLEKETPGLKGKEMFVFFSAVWNVSNFIIDFLALLVTSNVDLMKMKNLLEIWKWRRAERRKYLPANRFLCFLAMLCLDCHVTRISFAILCNHMLLTWRARQLVIVITPFQGAIRHLTWHITFIHCFYLSRVKVFCMSREY